MHLINDGLQVLMPLVTREELKEVHADKLQRELQDPLNNAKGTILNHGNNLIKVEQLNNDVEQSRQQRPFKMQNKEFNALVNAILEKKRAPEPKKIEVVQASSVPLTKAPRASLQTYLSFANNPANERKIIVDLQE